MVNGAKVKLHNKGDPMTIVHIQAHQIEKQYQQYYSNKQAHTDQPTKSTKNINLHNAYVKAYIKLLTSNIKN